MNVGADAVKRTSSQKTTIFLTASGLFLLIGTCLAGLYFYEESKISELQERFSLAIAPLSRLKSENTVLLNDKTALESQVKALDEENKQKIDDLSGRAKVLRYEKETLESDIAAKEKKITELEDRIQRQDLKEEQLMALIEQAKKQLARPAAGQAQ